MCLLKSIVMKGERGWDTMCDELYGTDAGHYQTSGGQQRRPAKCV
jgi:hypothetical protein